MTVTVTTTDGTTTVHTFSDPLAGFAFARTVQTAPGTDYLVVKRNGYHGMWDGRNKEMAA